MNQPGNKRLLRQCDLDLIMKAEEILLEDARNAGTLGFVARMLIQATLPHRDPGNVSAWGRRNGAFSLVIQPGIMINRDAQPISIGLPYGSLSRLLLAWISTEAVRTQKPAVVLGHSLSAFLRELDLLPTGGRWGSITRLRAQMKRLFAASISCTSEGINHWGNTGFRIADEASLWWNPKQPDQADLWQSTITLGQRFFKELLEHPVPMDMRAMKALRRSPMALDQYCWLTYRMSYLSRNTIIPWPMLMAQFGADYGRVDNFKVAFLDGLRKVLTVYPDANVASSPQGLQLKPSKTHIAR